eukprot:gene18138-19948_t
MRPNILPTFILCAIVLMEAKGQEQPSSGYGPDEWTTSTDDGSGSDGSGSNAQDVEKMVTAMKKLNKNKSDEDLSKNIKTGSYLKSISVRTFEKLSALWISIIRRLWKVWRAKGARQVMHSIVEKLVTHTGKKVTKALHEQAQRKSDTPGIKESTHSVSMNENLQDAPAITQPQTDVQKIDSEKANENTRSNASNTDVNSDFSLRQPAPAFGKPQVPLETSKESTESPTSSSTTGSVDSKNPEQTPTGGKNPEQTPTGSKDPEQATTGSKDPEQTPTGGKNPEQTPTGSKNPEQTPTASKNPEQATTGSKNPEQATTGLKNPEQSPTGLKNPEQTLTDSKNPEQTPTDSVSTSKEQNSLLGGLTPTSNNNEKPTTSVAWQVGTPSLKPWNSPTKSSHIYPGLANIGTNTQSQVGASSETGTQDQIPVSADYGNKQANTDEQVMYLPHKNSQGPATGPSTLQDDPSPQSVSINVENPIKDEVSSFVRNKDTSNKSAARAEDRSFIPQEQTPESITAYTGGPPDHTNLRKAHKKINHHHEKSKIKYRLHSHGHKHKKTSNTKGNLQGRYVNVNKHLIKRYRGKSPSARRQSPLYQHLLTKGTRLEGPISNQMESVLNANAAKSPIYTKSNYYSGAAKRHNYASGDEEIGDDETAEASSGETTAQTRNRKRKLLRRKQRKYRGKKFFSAKSHHMHSGQRGRASSNAGVYNTIGNKTFRSKTTRNEQATKKFRFVTFPSDLASNNQSILQNRGPVIVPAAAGQPQIEEATDLDSNESEQLNSAPDQSVPSTSNGQSELANAIQGQSEAQNVDADPSETPAPIPLLLLKPTTAQSEEPSAMTTHPIVPSSEPSPHFENKNAPLSDTDNSENVTVIAQEENNSEPEQQQPQLPELQQQQQLLLEQQQQQQQMNQNNAVFEEVRSLESRMTVLEAAVAEVIEWIKSHSIKPVERAAPPQIMLRPALPFPRPVSLPEAAEEEPGLHEVPVEHHPKVLKQIFIPLPQPDTEAEKELESGHPVNGLPYPLNVVVAKMMLKMLKDREQKRLAASHPHTPVPEVNIPAIEHDISNLEKELASVPVPLRHRHRHFRLHPPISDVHDEVSDAKHPLLGQLVSSEPEKGCTSSCQNGGVCLGNNICRCPVPYSGSHCELFEPIINQSPHFMIERQDASVPDSTRRSSFSQYNPSARQRISDNRERRRLVHMLKSLLGNLAANSASARKNNIPMDDILPPDYQSEDDGESSESLRNQGYPIKRNFWTWEELGCLAKTLGFQTDLFLKNIPEDRREDCKQGLKPKQIDDLLESKALSPDLHRTFNVHDAAYNMKVIEKSMQYLSNRILSFQQIKEARLAFQLYEHMDNAGLVISEHIIKRTLKMCGRAISPVKLMQFIKHMDRLVADRLMFYEFIEVLIISEKLPTAQNDEKETLMTEKTIKDSRNLYELCDFHDVLLTEDEKISRKLNDLHQKDMERIPVKKSQKNGDMQEKPWLVPSIVDHEMRETLVKRNKEQAGILREQLDMSNNEVLVKCSVLSCGCNNSAEISRERAQQLHKQKGAEVEIDHGVEATFWNSHQPHSSRPEPANKCREYNQCPIVTDQDLNATTTAIEEMKWQIATQGEKMRRVKETYQEKKHVIFHEETASSEKGEKPSKDVELKAKHDSSRSLVDLIRNERPDLAKKLAARMKDSAVKQEDKFAEEDIGSFSEKTKMDDKNQLTIDERLRQIDHQLEKVCQSSSRHITQASELCLAKEQLDLIFGHKQFFPVRLEREDSEGSLPTQTKFGPAIRDISNLLQRKIMPFKFFSKSKKSKYNNSDDKYTAILASDSHQEYAEDIMDRLQRSGQVIVNGKEDVVSGQRGSACANSQQVVQYIEKDWVTALVILSSDELERFFAGSSAVQLQLTGENVNLDARMIAESFKENTKIRSKLLVVVLPGERASCPTILQGVDVVHVGSDKKKWASDVVGKFMKKITLHN